MKDTTWIKVTRPGRFASWLSGVTAVTGIWLINGIKQSAILYERTLLFLMLSSLLIASAGLFVLLAGRRYTLLIGDDMILAGRRAYKQADITAIRLEENRRRIAVKSRHGWGWSEMAFARSQTPVVMTAMQRWADRHGIPLERR
ncbi:hypothetical protein [Paenibacillus puerhi]|uniref:hypothetical protein n=1 Tax=Paenibacillus puerhi TaxID=2692622 RepID=UPI00135A1E16|nr:hypothetical protein [Paenibacillus puerhi]